MRIESAVKIIIVLLCVLIVSVTAMLILTGNQKEEGEGPSVTTTVPSTPAHETTDDGRQTTDVADPTEPPVTTPSVTTPEETTPGTTVPPQTTVPPVIPPDGEVPEDFTLARTYRSESGTYLNLRAEVSAVVENGKVKVTLFLYLDHYSLFLGARSGGYVKIGNDKAGFVSPKIELEENVKTATPLVTHIAFFDYGEEINVYAYFPSKCTYGDVAIDALVINETLSLIS